MILRIIIVGGGRCQKLWVVVFAVECDREDSREANGDKKADDTTKDRIKSGLSFVGKLHWHAKRVEPAHRFT